VPGRIHGVTTSRTTGTANLNDYDDDDDDRGGEARETTTTEFRDTDDTDDDANTDDGSPRRTGARVTRASDHQNKTRVSFMQSVCTVVPVVLQDATKGRGEGETDECGDGVTELTDEYARHEQIGPTRGGGEGGGGGWAADARVGGEHGDSRVVFAEHGCGGDEDDG
jgi:hypothetical protein